MRHYFTGLLAAGLLAVTVAAPASAATNLDCMDSGYDAAGSAEIAAYVAALDFRAIGPPPVAYDAVLVARAQSCGTSHGWNAQAQEVAVQHQRARNLIQGLRRTSPVQADRLPLMDAAIDAADPAQLRRTMARLMAFARREGPGPDEADIAVIMPVFMASGLEMTNDSGVFTGAWMAARMHLRDLAAEFAAL